VRSPRQALRCIPAETPDSWSAFKFANDQCYGQFGELKVW